MAALTRDDEASFGVFHNFDWHTRIAHSQALIKAFQPRFRYKNTNTSIFLVIINPKSSMKEHQIVLSLS